MPLIPLPVWIFGHSHHRQQLQGGQEQEKANPARRNRLHPQSKQQEVAAAQVSPKAAARGHGTNSTPRAVPHWLTSEGDTVTKKKQQGAGTFTISIPRAAPAAAPRPAAEPWLLAYGQKRFLERSSFIIHFPGAVRRARSPVKAFSAKMQSC